MKIRIALAGILPSEQHIFGKIDLLIGQISGYLCGDSREAELQMLVSPSYTGETWMTWNKTHEFPLCTYNMSRAAGLSGEMCQGCISTEEEGQFAQIIRKATPLRNLLGEAMCDKADVLLVVWNEDVMELSGATWELMRIAYDRKVPCIWISSKSLETYCLWEAYYKKYSPQYLSAVSEPMQKEEIQPSEVDEEKGRLLSFWEKRRTNYLKKYKANLSVFPSEEDHLLERDFKLEQEVSEGEAVRQKLLEKFHQFDSTAIELNSRFQAMMYQRSVLPFITTIFLAVGFYAETLIGKTLSGIVPALASAVTILAALLAGTGFLIHGCLNLYVYQLSKSQRVCRWQKDFVNDRYMAEIFRVLIHFLPYGVDLDLRRICVGDRKTCMKIKHLTDHIEPVEWDLNRKTITYILKHVKEMLEDQITYHEVSVKRYKAIVDSLEKWGKRIFYVGFGVVLGRGCLQFLLTLSPIAAMNGVDLNSIVRSFLNMLALLLPAWAGYFSTKAQQNNFRYNLDNHQRMISKLQAIQERITHFQEQEEIPLEVFNIMIEELVETMLIEDASGWQYQHMNVTVKPL